MFSSIDFRHGYYQVQISPKDRHKTAFWVENMGQLAWNVSAQGLVNCPATFSRIMHRIFRKQIENNEVETYLDDVLCHSKTHSDMFRILRDLFVNLSNSGLKMNLQKCKFGADKLNYLGFEINKDGYCPSQANISTNLKAKPPTSLKMVKSFIGLLTFYHGSIRNYTKLIKPLSQLTSKKSNWHGGDLPPAALVAFQKSKEIMSKKPFIHHPNFDWQMHVYSDDSLGQFGADTGGLSGCLVQYENDDKTAPPRCLGFCSRSLKQNELGYSSFLLENAALSFTIDHFQRYLEGVHFHAYVTTIPWSNWEN